jgi:hypothetical protein
MFSGGIMIKKGRHKQKNISIRFVAFNTEVNQELLSSLESERENIIRKIAVRALTSYIKRINATPLPVKL